MALPSRNTLAATTMSTAMRALSVAAPAVPAHVQPFGWWLPNGSPLETESDAVREAARDLRQAVTLQQTPQGLALPQGGSFVFGGICPDGDAQQIDALLPACRPDQPGDRSICDDHLPRYPFVA